MALYNWVAADPSLRWDSLLARNLHHHAIRRIEHAVIHAAQKIPLAAPQREWSQSVNAAILEGDHMPVVSPIEHNRLPQDRDCEGLLLFELVSPCSNIPSVVDVCHRRHLIRMVHVSSIASSSDFQS
jgi:hypothetical protein